MTLRLRGVSSLQIGNSSRAVNPSDGEGKIGIKPGEMRPECGGKEFISDTLAMKSQETDLEAVGCHWF